MFKFGLLLIAGILLYTNSPLQAQDPEGELDHVYIVCGANGYSGSGQSEVSFEIWFKSDNTGNNKISSFHVAFIVTGNNIVSADTSIQKAFAGSMLDPTQFGIFAVDKVGNPDLSTPPFHMAYTAVSFEGGVTGEGLFVNLILMVNDTGVICIDTLSISEQNNNAFTTESAMSLIPGWGGTAGNGYPDGVGICCTVEQCTAIPGDANASGSLTLADIISTINYYFVKPNCLPDKIDCLSGLLCRGDWSGDGDATLVDIIWGINFMFDKDNPGTNCLGADPGNCWNPVPVFPCCQPDP